MISRRTGPAGVLKGLYQILKGRPRVPASLEENPLLQVILQRRSVRSFRDEEIPADVFAAILEAGRLAPSTVNLQTWSFAVFDRAQWQETFASSIPFHAQRAVIVIGDTSRVRTVLDVFPYCPLTEYTVAVMNASLAAMNMNIAAEALGVSSVMLSETGRSGLLDVGYLQEKLSLPEGAVPLMTIVFGYARGSRPVMPPKLPGEEIFFEGRYRPPDAETMDSWLNQMVVGYKASHLKSSFEGQLKVYQNKIGQAEEDLRKAIYRREGGT